MAIRPEIWNYISSRRVLARLFSTILCSILLVIFKYGSATAFLALTVKELVFSVQETLLNNWKPRCYILGVAWLVLACQ